ncbi:MAG: 50S ribosomal protein L4 [Chlamydiales bacterium]
MQNLEKYNLQGEVTGEVVIEDAFLNLHVNPQLVKDYIVALRANQRQWSANTKGRSEVSHSNKKPHRQKGTGNARQGTLAAPQYRGGGVVFGPKPKFNQHIRINRKERRLVSSYLFVEKIKNSDVLFLDDNALKELQKPSSKSIAIFLKKQKIYDKSVLFIVDGEYHKSEIDHQKSPISIPTDKYKIFKKSLNNLPKSDFAIAQNINGYDLISAQKIVMNFSAFEELKKLWRGE